MKQHDHSAFSTWLAAWVAVATIAFAGSAAAAPTSYVVCKAVASNGDAAMVDGGTFTLTASAAGSGSLGTFPLTVAEGASLCTAPQPFPAAGSDLVVNETITPPGWNHASSYPRWSITGPGIASAVTGNGVTATLSGANFASATGQVTVTVTNAKARTFTLCKTVENNGVAPVQTGTVTLRYSSTSLGATGVPVAFSEGGATTCSSTPVQLGASDTALTIQETNTGGIVNAAGYPKWFVTDANGTQEITARAGFTSLPLTGPGVLSTTTGPLTINVVNRPALPGATRSIAACVRWEDNGDAGYGTGFFNLGVAGDVSPNLAAVGLASSTEGGAEVCGTLNRPVENYTIVNNAIMSSFFAGFATGYPRWEIYDLATCPAATVNSQTSCAGGTLLAVGRTNGNVSATPTATGIGEWVEVDWSLVPAGVTPKVVIVNKESVFGNGVQANTGNLLQLCKQVATDADSATSPTGNFDMEVRLQGTTPRGYPISSSNQLALTHRPTNQGEGTTTCHDRKLALPDWATNVRVVESNYAGPNWLGNATAPQVSIVTAAGAPTATPASPLLMPAVLNQSTTQWVLTGLDLGAGLAAKDDLTLTIINTPKSARQVRVCVRMVDNGINGNEGGVFPFATDGNLDANLTVAEGTTACHTHPVYLADTQNTLFVRMNGTPASVHGYALGYPYAEYSWDGAPAQVLAVTGYRDGRIQETIPASVLTQQTSGILTYTYVIMASQRLNICKQVLNNGDAVNDAGTFAISGGDNATVGNKPTELSFNQNFTVGESTNGNGLLCNTVTDGVSNRVGSDATYFRAQEALPVAWTNTGGYPKWVAKNAAGATIAQGTGSTIPTGIIPRAAPNAATNVIDQGNVTITFVNRTGAPRFVQVCKEIDTNTNPAVITGSTWGLTVNSNDEATPLVVSDSRTVAEGNPYTTTGNCSTQVQLPDAATEISAAETAPANWPLMGGHAPGFPQWYIVNATGAQVLSGSGSSTGALALSSIGTPDFRIVFKNKADAATPVVTKAFSASPINLGATSVLTITLANTSAANAAVLTSALVDTLPGDVVIAATPNASTTCVGGSVTAAAGGKVVSLASVASIPAGGSCVVSVQVTVNAANPGAPCATNTIAAGALVTGLGNNTAPASAQLCVNYGGISVSKVIAGAPASFDQASASFSAYATCDKPVAGTRYPAAGGVSFSTAAPGVIGQIPSGASCVVSETNTVTPPAGYTWGTATYATNPVVVPTSGNGAVTVTNPLLGSITVSKIVTGGPAAAPAAGNFSMAVACTTTPFSQTVQVAAGASTTVIGIPTPNACTVTEGATLPPPPAGYAWGALPAAVSTSLAAGATGTATVTNTLTKLDVDPPAITKLASISNVATREIAWSINVANTAVANTNLGPQAVAMNDPLPASASFVSGSVACVASSGTVTITSCAFDSAVSPTAVVVAATLPFGTSITVTVKTTSAANVTSVSNTASASFTAAPKPTPVSATAKQALPASTEALAVPSLSGGVQALLSLLMVALVFGWKRAEESSR